MAAGDPGFRLARHPDTLRAPDVAFVSHERLAGRRDVHAFLELAPDLAVEVLSPSERPAAIARKVRQYLGHGTRAVWLIEPARGRLEQHRLAAHPAPAGTAAPAVEVTVLDRSEAVEVDPVLPGFGCTLGDLLPPP